MNLKDICNFITWPWPQRLLKLPRPAKIGLCFGCFLLCSLLYLFCPSPLFLHPVMLFLLPMGLSSWLFSKQGACTCFVGALLLEIVSTTAAFHGLGWTLNALFSLLATAVILFLTGSVLVSLRLLLDSADNARVQAEWVQHQTALALAQQRQFYHIKNQFLLHVNHEIRTPLTAISCTLELLQMFFNEQGLLNRETHARYLQRAINQCGELTSIVNNVLDTIDLSAENNPLLYETVVVKNVVQEALLSRDTFRSHPELITLDIPEQITVWADARALLHSLQHLLSNAFKYALAEAPIFIHAAQDRQIPDYVCISVRDHGPGIPPEEASSLFQQFSRLSRDSEGPIRGTGLGLYISKSLVEAMHGRIWVESSGIPGEGSTFYLSLPGSRPS